MALSVYHLDDGINTYMQLVHETGQEMVKSTTVFILGHFRGERETFFDDCCIGHGNEIKIPEA